jgi:hypothetical protein
MSYGWIKVHRQIQSHWLYTDKREFSYFEAWIDIILSVNHADAKTMIQGTLYEVKRGQSINSLDTWAKRWSWSKSKVRRFLKTLEIDSMVVLKNETITTRLTVCNYDSYQETRNADETQMKRKRNADETQMKPNKNDKECLTNDKQTTNKDIPTKSDVSDEEKAIYKERIKDFDIQCEKLLAFYNKLFEKKCRVVNSEVKAKLKKTLRDYDWKDIGNAMIKVKGDKHHIESGYKWATLEFFTRPVKLDMFAFDSEAKPTYTGEDAGLVNHIQNYYNK